MASHMNNTNQQQHGCVTGYGQGNIDEADLPMAVEVPHRQVNAPSELNTHREYLAYAIPQDGTSAVANDSPHVVKVAELRGKIANEEERGAIEKAGRDAFSKHYFIDHAVKEANQRAKIRDAQGLQVESDRLVTTSALDNNTTEQQQLTKTPIQNQVVRNTPGYQVKEYRMTSDYETKEYKVQEYKSLYD